MHWTDDPYIKQAFAEEDEAQLKNLAEGRRNPGVVEPSVPLFEIREANHPGHGFYCHMVQWWTEWCTEEQFWQYMKVMRETFVISSEAIPSEEQVRFHITKNQGPFSRENLAGQETPHADPDTTF